jgi:hypothetical protein
MTQERKTQRESQALAKHGPHELSDDDLVQVAGGSEGPGNPTDGTGVR